MSGWTEGSLGGPHAGSADVWLARYDGAGNQIWIRQLGTNTPDRAWAAAPDGSDGVYVTGETYGSIGGPNAGGSDVWLARYDGAGNQTWIRQFGTSTDDEASAAAPDGAGGVYVSGSTWSSLGGLNAGFEDAWIARYDSAGNQTWTRQFGTNEYDNSFAAAPDGSGGVYVSGRTRGSLGGPIAGNEDAWLARYDSTGNQSWVRQLGSSARDVAWAAAPDGSGGVYVSGSTTGSLGGPLAGQWDAWVARYDGAGNQTWIRQLGTNSVEFASAAAPDGSGGVYVSGRTDGGLGGPNAGDFDNWLARYDSAGHQTWIRQLGTSSYENASAAAPDGLGGVYVSGSTLGSLGGMNAGGADAWLARYEGGLTASSYCTPAVPNSSGQPGVLMATGSNAVHANDVTLVASQLSLNSFGIFLTSRDQGITFPMSNSQGRLCLGGFIGRYVGPGQLMNSGATGTFSLAIDLTAVPTPFGNVAVPPGDTWNFQGWHRDANPNATSNFTDAVSITFF